MTLLVRPPVQQVNDEFRFNDLSGSRNIGKIVKKSRYYNIHCDIFFPCRTFCSLLVPLELVSFCRKWTEKREGFQLIVVVCMV